MSLFDTEIKEVMYLTLVKTCILITEVSCRSKLRLKVSKGVSGQIHTETPTFLPS